MIRIALAQLSAFIAVFLFDEGIDYIQQGIGIHPILAGIGIAIAIAVPWIAYLHWHSN